MSQHDQPRRKQRSDRPAMRVGKWVVHPDLGVVRSGDDEVRLNPKSLEVLLVLIDAGSRGVSRGALLDSVWGQSYPSDAVVSRAIADLRAAFGEKAGEQRYIRTLPKYGYQLVAAVAPLSEAEQEPAAAQPEAAGPAGGSGTAIPRWRYALLSGAALLAVLVTAAVTHLWTDTPAPPSLNENIEAGRPLSADPGLEHQPRLAPDAQWVVYAAKASGRDDWDLYRAHLTDGTRLVVAADPGVSEHGPAYAPDGRQLAYVRFDAQGCVVVVDDLLPGGAQTIAECTSRFPTLVDWAPDGRHLAYSSRAADDPMQRRRIYQVDLDSGTRRALTDAVSATGTDYYPRYSPSGRQLAFLRGEPQPDHRSTLWVVDLNSGIERQVQAPAAQLGGMSWQDQDQLLYAINEFGQWTLYRLGIHSGEQQRLRAPELIHPEFNADASTLVAASVERRVGLLQLDAHGAEAGAERPATALAVSTADDYAGRLSPDGRTLAFLSTRSGHAELWVADHGNSAARQLTRFEGPPVRSADWHPSGESLLFTVATEQGERLHRVQLITGQIQPFGPEVSVAAPRWLGDGERWVAGCRLDGQWQICVGHADSVRPLKVRLFRPQPIGPDTVAAVDDAGTLMALNLEEGSTAPIWDGLPDRGRYGWEIDGDTLYYLREAGINGQGQLIGRDIDSGFESVLFQGDLPLADTSVDVSAEAGTIVLTGFQAASDDLQVFRFGQSR